MNWELEFTKAAIKDAQKLKQAALKKKAQLLLDILKKDPFQTPPPYEKLIGDLDGVYSRRINTQHRLVYMVNKTSQCVRVLRMWTHYE